MKNETGITVPTPVLAMWAVMLAAVMQLGVMLTLNAKLNWRQFVGALIVSGLFGGCITVITRDYLHWPVFVAGVLGTLSGMLPAAVAVMGVSRKALERAGITPDQITEMARITQGQAAPEDKQNGPDEQPA